MKQFIFLFSFLLFASVCVSAQINGKKNGNNNEAKLQDDIVSTVGYNLTASKLSLGVTYRKNIFKNIYASPEVFFHTPTPGQGLLYNLNGNLYYELPIPGEGYFIYILGGVGYANYSAYATESSHSGIDEETGDSYEVTSSILEFEKGRTIFTNTGFGVDGRVSDNQFIRFEFRVAFGGGHTHALLNGGWGFRF